MQPLERCHKIRKGTNALHVYIWNYICKRSYPAEYVMTLLRRNVMETLFIIFLYIIYNCKSR